MKIIKFFKNLKKLNELADRVETHADIIDNIMADTESLYNLIRKLKSDIKNIKGTTNK